MAVAFRSNSTYAPATGTTSHVVPTPTGFQAGDLLVVALTNPVSASISPPDGSWTEIVDHVTTNGANNFNAYLAWKIASGSEGASQTFTATVSGRPAGGMAAFSGVDQTAAVNQSAANEQGTTGTSYGSASITPTVDNCMIAGLFYGYKGSAGTLSFTPDASFTEQADIPNTNNGAALELQTKLQTSAAAIACNATSSATSVRYSVILAIAPPAGSTITVPFIAAGTTVHAPTLSPSGAVAVSVPFIAAATTVYPPTLAAPGELDIPFITASTTLYAPTLTASGSAALNVPFIASTTTVHAPVLVRVDTIPPTLKLIGAYRSKVTLVYDEALDPGTPLTSEFAVTVNGVANTVTGVSVAGSSVTLTLTTAVASGDRVLVSYTG